MPTPNARPTRLEDVELSPALERRLRDAIEASERDEGRALTPEEMKRMAETGEWPDWCASSG